MGLPANVRLTSCSFPMNCAARWPSRAESDVVGHDLTCHHESSFLTGVEVGSGDDDGGAAVGGGDGVGELGGEGVVACGLLDLSEDVDGRAALAGAGDDDVRPEAAEFFVELGIEVSVRG